MISWRSWIGGGRLATAAVAVMCVGFNSVATQAADDEAPRFVLNVGGIEQEGGTIRGVVKFEGRQARQRPIQMTQDPFCAQAHAGDHPVLNEMFVFGEDNTLQNVFVWVSKGLEGKTFDVPEKPAELDQYGCIYVPHVRGKMAGQTLAIHNSDNTLHNVRMDSRHNGSMNEGMPVKDMVLRRTFNRPEMGLAFKCDVHPWMTAYLHVMEHPFYAVTQADGTFTIRGLPPGEYEVSVWHEFDRFTPDAASQTVTVTQGQESELTFTYRPPGS